MNNKFRLPISSLNNETIQNGHFVLGLVLKKSLKSYTDKKTNEFRQVLSLLVRDESGYAVVKVWKDAPEFEPIAEEGAVVKIQGPAFKLAADGTFELHISAGTKGLLLEADPGDLRINSFRPPSIDYVPLNATGGFVGNLVNIFAVVKRIFDTKPVTTKRGDTVDRRSILLCDAQSPAFFLTFWGEDLRHVSERWIEKQTALHIANVRINEYNGRYGGTYTFASAIVENPDLPDLKTLQQAALINDALDHSPLVSVDPKDVVDFYFVRAVEQFRMRKMSEEIFGNLIGVVTKADFAHRPCLQYVCSSCNKRMVDFVCQTPGCSAGDPHPVLTPVFDLTDSTGTLQRIRLYDRAAEVFMGVTATDFMGMTLQAKEALEERILWKRMKLTFRHSHGRVQPLHCVPAESKSIQLSKFKEL